MREALIIEARGERFRFYYDLKIPEALHITLRHGTTPEDAIKAFFEGETSPWDETHWRYETLTGTHGMFWLGTFTTGRSSSLAAFSEEISNGQVRQVQANPRDCPGRAN